MKTRFEELKEKAKRIERTGCIRYEMDAEKCETTETERAIMILLIYAYRKYRLKKWSQDVAKERIEEIRRMFENGETVRA